MTTCMYCGAQLPDNVKFCTSCGAALPVEAPIEQPVYDAGAQQPGVFNPNAAQPYDAPSSDQQYQQPYQQPQYDQQQPYQQQYQQPGQQTPYSMPGQPVVNDSGSIGWGILGFLFPIVGVILYFVWRTTKPNSAKVAGIGAIIGFVVNLAITYSGFLDALV